MRACDHVSWRYSYAAPALLLELSPAIADAPHSVWTNHDDGLVSTRSNPSLSLRVRFRPLCLECQRRTSVEQWQDRCPAAHVRFVHIRSICLNRLCGTSSDASCVHACFICRGGHQPFS